MRDADETRSGFLRGALPRGLFTVGVAIVGACVHHRLILTDHLRKERWVGTPEQLINFDAQDMKSMEMWFTEPVE